VEITTDEAKDEIERLLIAPVQIGSMWADRKTNAVVVVRGMVQAIVRFGEFRMSSTFEDMHLVAFHARFVRLDFE
jgi:hypothetical protein